MSDLLNAAEIARLKNRRRQEAIKLLTPDSGDAWLDTLICKRIQTDFFKTAVHALFTSSQTAYLTKEELVAQAKDVAALMLDELNRMGKV